ncbi:Mur ligase [Panaeolus papilionaceus]|nr:Mur ligase [Panaeolus papilionaceus]
MSIDLSLDRLRTLVSHLPPYTRPTLHIAGTNGKGSVSAILSSILISSSFKVGRYNSPHLVSIYDCITIDNTPVPAELYHQTRQIVEAKDKECATGLTNFELLTVTALQIFEVLKVDTVVLEVGMGGRLDATNIIPDETVLVSALTAVDLDHQAFLGDTVEKIAKEKAGIARPGKPFVLGAQTHRSVENVVQTVVQEAKATLVHASKVLKQDSTSSTDSTTFSLLQFQKPSPQPLNANLSSIPSLPPLQLPLQGDHQLDNLAVALGVVDSLLDPSYSNPLKHKITTSSIASGIASVQWPGRLSFQPVNAPLNSETTVDMNVLVDGAHNAASAKTLSAYISHLLDLDAQSCHSEEHHTVHVTYILALSHSPPKLPIQTLSEILPVRLPPNSRTKVQTSVALPWFSKPDGMPWIKRVPLPELKAVVHELVPNAEIWTSPVQVEEDSTNLMDALKWVASRQRDGERNLIVLAGSLYLVADLYRVCGFGL